MTELARRSSGTRGRNARRRYRHWFPPLLAIGVVLVIGVGVMILTQDDATKPVAQPPLATTTTTLPPTTTTLPKPADVATSAVPSLQVFDAPNSSKVIATLSDKTEYLQPRTLLVTETNGAWLKALLPMRPNQSEGWIRLSDVRLSQNPYRITVNLAERTVRLYKDGQEILSSLAVIGSDRTPTPIGRYYITDPVDLTSRPGGPYGAFALGLSAYSEVLFEFNGGPGQIAIHGTSNPELVGQNVSNGCIRLPNDVILQIAGQAPLGTPVEIT